jgi:cytochrome c2
MKPARCIAVLALVGACRSKGDQLAARNDAPAPSNSAATTSPSHRGAEIVNEACLACHSEEMLRQQRLTPAQWDKVVKKMAGWGANVAVDDVPIVSAYLTERYGIDAGPYEVSTMPASDVLHELASQPSALYDVGNADRGGSLYGARCASCHGADARGQIGVNLVDRPLLYRPVDFARVVATGRPKMPAQPSTTDTEVADMLAYLRRMRPSR